MLGEQLQIGQYVLKHPILTEKENYKRRYINLLECFVRKYSKDDIWANSMLKLYGKKLLDEPDQYVYEEQEIKDIRGNPASWREKIAAFFHYRYCLCIDIFFLCAYKDKKKGNQIYQEILRISGKKNQEKMISIFECIYYNYMEPQMPEQAAYMCECLKKNYEFSAKNSSTILVTANMSAGKSTLLNALAGKKVNKTQNDACTAKVHYLINKAFEDGLIYKYDYELELDATTEMLMDDNEANKIDELYVAARFRSVADIDARICLIDTPGVNSSQDAEHKEISESAIINRRYGTLIFLLNGENIGTDDDRRHLAFIADNYHGRVVFVINKLDRYKAKEDSVVHTIEQVRKDLKELGYAEPTICPVSAYAGYLAKMHIYGETLNEDEQDELERFYRKLSKEEFQFQRYYPQDIQDTVSDIEEDKDHQLLLHSGILSLEAVLYQ